MHLLAAQLVSPTLPRYRGMEAGRDYLTASSVLTLFMQLSFERLMSESSIAAD